MKELFERNGIGRFPDFSSSWGGMAKSAHARLHVAVVLLAWTYILLLLFAVVVVVLFCVFFLLLFFFFLFFFLSLQYASVSISTEYFKVLLNSDCANIVAQREQSSHLHKE